MGARRPVVSVMVTFAVLAGLLVWGCVPALAAAPEAPGPVLVGPAGAFKVVVRGVLSPHAEGQPGTYEFLYRASSTDCEGGEHAPALPGLASGVQGEEVAQELTGLSPQTEYTVCLLERNLNQSQGEETVGPAMTFKTTGMLEAPVVSTPASGITASSIKVQGLLNPGAPGAPGTYEFVYRSSANECQRENLETHQRETEFATPTESALGGEKEVVPAAPVEIGGLEPNTAYTFCLQARNEAGETVVSSPVTFTTLSSKPSLNSESFSKVGPAGVTITAEIGTGGLATTASVQYGTTSAYGSETAGVVTPLPEDTATVTTQLSGLESNTEYHFRILITNDDGNRTSVDKTFTTLLAGTDGLPDNRVYEMVTPPDDDNSDVMIPEGGEGTEYGEGIGTHSPFKVAMDGSAITYHTLAIAGARGTMFGSQYLAERSPAGGWVQTSLEPSLGAYPDFEYQGFSEDLSVGIVQNGTPPNNEPLPPVTADALGEGYGDLYARPSSEGVFRPLITNAVKPNRPVEYSGLHPELPPPFGTGEGVTVSAIQGERLAFAGGSADFNDLLFEANDALLPGEGVLEKELEQDAKKEIAAGENINYLYDDAGGSLNLVDISPEGKVVPGATFGAASLRGGGNPPDFSHVISADGRRIYWTDSTSGIVFVRVNESNTVQVSAGSARYWTASTNGRYAIYTEGEGAGSELYRFDMEPETGHEQREALTAANAGVLGVLGASEDGETVYFVATGVLAGTNSLGAAPIGGQRNLYVLSHGGPPVFIATLSEQDEKEVAPYPINNRQEAEYGDWQPGFGQRTAQVTGDGGSVVFMSNQSLSVVGHPQGYPSRGSDQVYVYEAASNRVYCASCGSSGEGVAAAYLPISWRDTYLPQWISADGNRVFFDASAPLVAQDTNGKQDVYEWEREGYDSCTHGSGSTGGCVFLLSGGTSSSASWFVGASANGDDAFIVTRAPLVPEDGNEAFDLYDARVDGVKPTSPPVCTGSGCQGVPAPPPLFATPPSVTFDGVGNFSAPPGQSVASKSKSKSLTRAQKLANALKQCKQQRRSKRRVPCEVQARKLYGAAGKRSLRSSKSAGGKHV
jgi:hypothetical protein